MLKQASKKCKRIISGTEFCGIHWKTVIKAQGCTFFPGIIQVIKLEIIMVLNRMCLTAGISKWC